MTLVSMLIAVSAAVAVVAGATDRAPGHRAPGTPFVARPRPAPPAAATAAPRVRAVRPQPPPAVDKLIRSTPIVTAGVPHARVIALTFDDGPSPYTPQIVAALLRLRAPATFFVVGQQLEYFSAGLRDEVRHHFEIGDHTENHQWLIWLRRAQQKFQIRSVAAQMRRLGAPAPSLFRPPYGAYNRATLSVLRGLHMLGVLWSIDPGDWRLPGTGAIVKGVLSAARPGGIVELHDGGGDRSETLKALPGIVNGLRRRNYRLVTVSRLLTVDPPARHQRLPQHLNAA